MSKFKNAVAMPEESEECQKYEIEEAARTLLRAEEIKEDPKLFAAVQKHFKKQKRAISSIADIRQASKEMDESEEDED